MARVGINIGAVSVKAVSLDGRQVRSWIISHNGLPLKVVADLVKQFPLRIAEAILKPLSLHDRIPILTYESDGFSVSPAFLRQVDVHIRQVLAERVVLAAG